MAALESGQFKGGWVDRPKGGYYYLQKVERYSSPESLVVDLDEEAERKAERETMRKEADKKAEMEMLEAAVPVAKGAETEMLTAAVPVEKPAEMGVLREGVTV